MSTRDKRIMQLLTILLLVSLLINLIAIVSREHKVSEGYSIAAKDSIISSLNKEKYQLEIELTETEEAYRDSIESLKNKISTMQSSNEKFEEQLKKLNEQVKNKEVQEAKKNEIAKKTKEENKKALTGKLRILIKGEISKSDSTTLIGNISFTEHAIEGTPEYNRRRKNTLEQLRQAEEGFKKIGEESNYKKLYNIIKKYKKSDKKKVQAIVDELDKKYK